MQSAMARVFADAAAARAQATEWATSEGPPAAMRLPGGFDKMCAARDAQVRTALKEPAVATPSGSLLQVVESVVPLLTRFAPGTSATQHALEFTALADSADQGKVSLTLNTASAASRERTARFVQVRTRADYEALLQDLRMRFVKAAVKPATWKVRVYYVRWWARYCLMRKGETPWRHLWELMHRLSVQQHRFEEELLEGFRDEVEERYGPTGCAAQAISHVRQWHLLVLRIPFPEFQMLQNDLRSAARRTSKARAAGHTKARRAATLVHVQGFCLAFRSDALAQADFWLVQECLVLRTLVSFCWFLRFRVGELARGGEFDPALHWTAEDLCELLSAKDSSFVELEQQERKVLHINTEEPMIVLIDVLPFCPAQTYRELRRHDPNPPKGHSALRVGAHGLPPTADDCRDRFVDMGQRLFPEQAALLAFSDHIWRIGGAAAGRAVELKAAQTMAGTGAKVAEKAMGMVPGSATLDQYQRDTIEGQCSVQFLMARTQVRPVQDAVRKPASKAAAARASAGKPAPGAVQDKRQRTLASCGVLRTPASAPPTAGAQTARSSGRSQPRAHPGAGPLALGAGAQRSSPGAGVQRPSPGAERRPASFYTADWQRTRQAAAAIQAAGQPETDVPPWQASQCQFSASVPAAAGLSASMPAPAAAGAEPNPVTNLSVDSAASSELAAEPEPAYGCLPHDQCKWDGFDWDRFQIPGASTICRRFQFDDRHNWAICPYRLGHYCCFCKMAGTGPGTSGWSHMAVCCSGRDGWKHQREALAFRRLVREEGAEQAADIWKGLRLQNGGPEA